MPTNPKIDPIAFLVYRKFPELNSQAEYLHKLLLLKGAPSKKTWNPPSKALVKKSENYQTKLSKLPNSEIEKLYKEELEIHYIEEDQKKFFHEPSADADFEYWAKMAD